MIRQIGEEFWDEWFFDDHSTESYESRIKYRVVEVVKVHKYGDFGPLIDAERLEPIEIEKQQHTYTLQIPSPQ